MLQNWKKFIWNYCPTTVNLKNMKDTNDLNICIVGAAGQMGSMFKRMWAGKLKQINELDLEPGKTALSEAQLKAALPSSDVIIFSVPINKLEDAVKSVAPHLPHGCIVTDVSSVKMLPMQIMEKYCPASAAGVVGAHPLFGPESMEGNGDSSPGLDNRFLQKELNQKRVAIVPEKKSTPEQISTVDALFRLAGCLTFTCTPEEHDRAVAVIQGLNFISNLAYFSTAADLPELDKFVTPSFKRRLQAAKTMLTEDAELFVNIARHTPQLREAMESYTHALEEAAKLDSKAIGDMLRLAGSYFTPENN